VELTEIERFEYGDRLAVRVAGLNGLDPDDLTGQRVKIGDSTYVVEAGYGPSLGEPFALMLVDQVIDR
jgi:hypothetical protein